MYIVLLSMVTLGGWLVELGIIDFDQNTPATVLDYQHQAVYEFCSFL